MAFSFNKRIIETISKDDCDEVVKELLRSLLYLEIRNYDTSKSTYSKEYDKIIKELSETYGSE